MTIYSYFGVILCAHIQGNFLSMGQCVPYNSCKFLPDHTTSRGHIRSHLLIYFSSPALAYSHKSLRPTHTIVRPMPQFQATRAIRGNVKRVAPIHLPFFQSFPGLNTAEREGEHIAECWKGYALLQSPVYSLWPCVWK
jgi:hypothetical protein